MGRKRPGRTAWLASRGLATFWPIGAIACLGVIPAHAAEGDIAAPSVEVVGRTRQIRTSDAASEGSVTYKLIEDRPVMRPGESPSSSLA
jgi:hypothetical protein